MFLRKATTASALFFSVLLAASCGKDDDNGVPLPTVVKEWNIPLSAKNENPAPAGRNEAGSVVLQLLSDNSLKYNINVTGLAAGDVLNAAHLHTGNVISNGPIVQGLDPVFTGGAASGTVRNLRSTLVDSLKSDANEIYFNAHSVQVPSGLVRGQLNIRLDFVADVPLSPANEVPAVTSTATGLATFRLTTDKKLYTRYTVTNVEADDALTASHVHKAAAGANGPIIIPVYASAAEFGTVKIITLDDAQITSLKTETVYANAHSVKRPAGIVRGQIR
jgi:hypothetical protein